VEKGVESSTVGKGKRKAALARAKVYAEMDEPASTIICRRVSALTHLLTMRPVFHSEDKAEGHHHST
jgi:hypothetical protein